MGHRRNQSISCIGCLLAAGFVSLVGCQRGDETAPAGAITEELTTPGLTPCGLAFCADGQYCCNPGCSMCVKNGAVCAKIYCGPAGPPCGGGFCPAGEVCCNPSCGICTPLGGVCTDQICETLP